MRRSSDAPRTPKAKQTATDAKADEAIRAVGRGTTAMRDAAGNILEMNPAAPYPLLTPQGIDAAVAFMPDGTIKMTSTDTAEDRDMTVRDITSSGEVHANKLSATGQTTCQNLTATSANLATLTSGFTQVGNLKSAQINTVGDIYTPGYHINTDPNGAMYSKDYYGGTFRGVYVNTSDARLKEGFTEVDEEDVDALARVPVTVWRYRDDAHNLDEQEWHVGPVAQDMPAIAVTTDVDIRRPMVESDDGEMVPGEPFEGPTHGRLGIDQVTYTGLLLALVQRQGRDIELLKEQVDELRRTTPGATE